MHRLQDPRRDQGKTGTGLTISTLPAEHYTGRFAPSPTGPLHLGSLICALASYLDARHQRGRWLVRMEDLDPPREQPGAARGILNSLEAHGLEWDGDVLWQSTRAPAYDQLIATLLDSGMAFRCDCSRAQLTASGGVYNGRCRNRQLSAECEHAVRVAVKHSPRLRIDDQIQPALEQALATEVGDFVIRRRDGLTAYQLAVVVDDAEQGVTHVVRGSDLYDSTPRQVYLQHVLGFSTPHYAHIPVMTNAQGQKLSKQTHAAALENHEAASNLRRALQFLRQPAPPAQQRSCKTILTWALEHWSPDAVPARMGIPESASG